MTWLLILNLTFAGQTMHQPVGLMLDERACVIAGAGMAAILENANPGLVVTVSCAPERRV